MADKEKGSDAISAEDPTAEGAQEDHQEGAKRDAHSLRSSVVEEQKEQFILDASPIDLIVEYACLGKPNEVWLVALIDTFSRRIVELKVMKGEAIS